MSISRVGSLSSDCYSVSEAVNFVEEPWSRFNSHEGDLFMIKLLHINHKKNRGFEH